MRIGMNIIYFSVLTNLPQYKSASKGFGETKLEKINQRIVSIDKKSVKLTWQGFWYMRVAPAKETAPIIN